MSRSVSSFNVLVIAGAAALLMSCGGGDKKLELGGTCSLNSDCVDPLMCKFGSCHKACMQTRDCATGERCVQVDGMGVCQLTTEAKCMASGCSAPLTCSSDNICRNSCQTAATCLKDQDCVASTCMDLADIAALRGDAGAGADSGLSQEAGSTSQDAALGRDDVAQVVDRTADRPTGADAVVSKDIAFDMAVDSSWTGDTGTTIDSLGTPAKCSGTPLTITYDGTATPDSSAFAAVFSSQVFPGTSWSVADGALAMTSVSGRGIWFGNDDSVDPVSWKFAAWDQGNTLTIRCKLGPNSQGFHFYFYNTAPEPGIYFMPGYVRLGTVAVGGRRDIDTSVYHTYGVSQNGSRRIWSIDGVEVANEALSTAASTKTPYVIIGDGSGPSPGDLGYETGTFYISEVVIKTYTSCTP